MPKTDVTEEDREIKDSPMPSHIGQQRIREAVKKVSRSQLAIELAEATGTNRKTASQFLESLSQIAYREAKRNGEFAIPGIGKLVKRRSKARVARNPVSGREINIPSKTIVRFRVAKAVKDSVIGMKK